MPLLVDIGNTHTHLGLARGRTLGHDRIVPTAAWRRTSFASLLPGYPEPAPGEGAVLCSVVPNLTARVIQRMRGAGWKRILELNARTVRGVGVDYPRPETIGPDRLANAVAARHHFGSPVIVVDFGTALTFDVVDAGGSYRGGVIAPGLAAMTDYLHEKTALLPRVTVRAPRRAIGRSTEEAMLSGAVHGYRGLVRGILAELHRELSGPPPTVVATGGCSRLLARGLPEIHAVRPRLTLEGLRLTWEAHLREPGFPS